jgi:hypothetical protein
MVASFHKKTSFGSNACNWQARISVRDATTLVRYGEIKNGATPENVGISKVNDMTRSERLYPTL